MKKFKVWDVQEYRETLGYSDTMAGVRRLCKERVDDTDGDCYVVYAPLNPETNKYKFSENKIANY